MVTIATNLKDDSTNVTVNTIEELEKFATFVNGELYIWDKFFNEWTTYTEQKRLEQLNLYFEACEA